MFYFVKRWCGHLIGMVKGHPPYQRRHYLTAREVAAILDNKVHWTIEALGAIS